MAVFYPSRNLVAATKLFEGLRLRAYRDVAGVLTIGYGHTGKDVREGMAISEARAEELLKEDLAAAGKYVNRLYVCKTQGQYDALTDFVYNLGSHSLAKSTLLKRIRMGRPVEEIQKEFRRWVYAGGKVQRGLVRRRNWEALRYSQDD